MGQQISNCQTGDEPSIGSVEPHMLIGERRKLKLPGEAPNSLLFPIKVDNTVLSLATASTSPSSPLGSSSGTICNGNSNDTNLPLRYTTSTRNLQNQTLEASATTATATLPSALALHPRLVTSVPAEQHDHEHTRARQVVRKHRNKGRSFSHQAGHDKRSNPVKFPHKRTNPEQRNDTGNTNGSSHLQETPKHASYLERMYDSRTWEMYRRITTYREKLEAFNAANESKRENDDDRNSTNRTYMSDPVQRVTNSSTMEGGVDYDNFYDPAMDDDDESRGGGMCLLEDHSAPPYHHHRQSDNGQHHRGHSGVQCHNGEAYSEWEHMYGDDGETGKNATNTEGGNHETIFLFDF